MNSHSVQAACAGGARLADLGFYVDIDINLPEMRADSDNALMPVLGIYVDINIKPTVRVTRASGTSYPHGTLC
jgi:hypothetical protein